MDEFNIDILELDYNKPTDKKLIKLFEYYFHLNERVENPEQATKELIETFMAVVRSHNNLRRNWHPSQSLACDMQVLNFLNKKELKSLIKKEMREAMTIASNGDKDSLEKAIEKTATNIVKKAYPNKKGSNYSHLEAIVRRILKQNPDATPEEIINEMRSNRNEYDIQNIDDDEVEITIPQRSEKSHKTKIWKLSRVKNILTKIRPSRP